MTVFGALILPRRAKKRRKFKYRGTLSADDSCQGLVEYSLIVGLVVTALFTAITQKQCSVQQGVTKIWSQVETQITDATRS